MLITPSPLVDIIEITTRAKYAKKYPSNVYELDGARESDDFTILVPVYNGERYLPYSLSSIKMYKDKTIVIDDASTDRSSEITKIFGFDVIRNEERGNKVGAIGKGLEHVTTTYTVILDCDTRIKSAEKLRRLVGKMFDESLNAAGAQVLPEIDENSGITEKLQFIEYKKGMEVGRKSMIGRIPRNICISGAFGVFNTKELKEVTETQINAGCEFRGEDLERTLLFLERGARIGYFEKFEVRTIVPSSIGELTKQRIKWQYGYLDKHLKFKGMLKRKDRIGATFLYNYIVNIGIHPLKLLSLPFLLIDPLILSTFLATYAMLGGATFHSISSEDEWKKYRKYIPLIPFYEFYNVMIPTTIGYCKCVLSYMRRK